MYSAVSSSPLTAGRSYQRSSNTQQARAAAVAQSSPRPGVGGGSGSHSISSSLRSAVESGLTINQLILSRSAAWRNVSSSPTITGDITTACAERVTGSVVHGFAPVATASASLPANLLKGPGARRPAGLLSQEMGGSDHSSSGGQEEPRQQQPALPPLPEVSALHYTASLEARTWFPDVDRTLLDELQARHPVFHTELASTAFMLAAKALEGQRRKDGSAQLAHSTTVALQLAELGLDAETVAAGLLHDALRSSTPSFRAQVEEFMPGAVIELADRVTTIGQISQLYRHHKDALGDEHMRRLLLAMEDVRAMLVQLACRVHDMKTVSALPREAQVALAQEVLDVFSVVANRLGVWSLKAELEDLAFGVLHPEEFQALQAQVSGRQDTHALESTIQRIKASLDARGVRYEDISGRPKNLYGIWSKMRANPNITSLEQVYDMTALRVVVTHKHDCYVALRCLQETYRTMPERSKDYIKGDRKPNGYQSLHETIFGEGGMPVEVQIRTHKMHYIAEYGFAAHWRYKERLSNEDKWLDKEVQYKKWLTTYKLGLHDKKVRASGGPLRETALDALGMRLIDASHAPNPSPNPSPAPTGQRQAAHDSPRGCIAPQPAAATQQQQQDGWRRQRRRPASFSAAPAGSGGVSGAAAEAVDPFLQHARFRLQVPAKRQVDVVLQTQDGVEIRQLPAGYSASSLAAQLQLDQLPGYAVLVNQRRPAPGQALCSGDLVQVVSRPASSFTLAGGPGVAVAASAPASLLMARAASSTAGPAAGEAAAARRGDTLPAPATADGTATRAWQGAAIAGVTARHLPLSRGLRNGAHSFTFLGSSNGRGAGASAPAGLPLSAGSSLRSSRRRLSAGGGAPGTFASLAAGLQLARRVAATAAAGVLAEGARQGAGRVPPGTGQGVGEALRGEGAAAAAPPTPSLVCV